MSHITKPHRPIDGFINITMLSVAIERGKQAKLNNIPIRVLFMKNLNAYLTVPSSLSCIMEVGKYDIKLNNSCKSFECTKMPVTTLQTLRNDKIANYLGILAKQETEYRS